MWQKEWRNSKEISVSVDLGEDFKFHLVGWKSSCIPIRQGGLGIKCLSYNKALSGKWLWRYGSEEEALWCQVVDVKYGLGDVQRK